MQPDGSIQMYCMVAAADNPIGLTKTPRPPRELGGKDLASLGDARPKSPDSVGLRGRCDRFGS